MGTYVNALLFIYIYILFSAMFCFVLFSFVCCVYPHLISSFYWLLCVHCSWRDGVFIWSSFGDTPVPDPLMSEFMTAHKVSPMDGVRIYKMGGTFHFRHYVIIR